MPLEPDHRLEPGAGKPHAVGQQHTSCHGTASKSNRNSGQLVAVAMATTCCAELQRASTSCVELSQVSHGLPAL
jgi:hypothetical protein